MSWRDKTTRLSPPRATIITSRWVCEPGFGLLSCASGVSRVATPLAVDPSCDHVLMPTSAQVLALLDDGYVRLKEIGQMLGVTLQRAQQLAAEPGFPRPSQVVGRSRTWRRDEIERWAADSYWARKPWYTRGVEIESERSGNG